MDCPDWRLKKKNQENKSYHGRLSGHTSLLDGTHTECQALKLIHPALEPDTWGASFIETEPHPLEWTQPTLEQTLHETLPKFYQITYFESYLLYKSWGMNPSFYIALLSQF